MRIVTKNVAKVEAAVKSSFLLIHHRQWLIEYRRVRVWFRSLVFDRGEKEALK